MKTKNLLTNSSEKKFYESLKDVFIGIEVEGQSGYINLMRIKSKYFDVVLETLQEEIEDVLKEFPEFREEFFNKLYNFFKRYFSESGSVYYRRTPFNEQIFERVYTDLKDVVLFWKTHMLYYVKTDIQFREMELNIEDSRFHFDVSNLKSKTGWEKKALVYNFKEIGDAGQIVFDVQYSERGSKTKIAEILKQLKNEQVENITEELLKKAFNTFEKQNEIDYFISKNASKFLRDQFDQWFFRYIYGDETDFSEKRIKQLKSLQGSAYKVIDFISQFEDELLKIWYKPKFALSSNYVISLDRIAGKNKGNEILEKIINHLNFEKQRNEWRECKLINEKTTGSHLFTNTLRGKELKSEYQYLPLDTKYFKDLELEILSLFDEGLDKELDGWLIHSENWQALNTLSNKFREKVKLIYIDPPFNTGSNDFTMYINRFLDTAWLTMMENRLRIARNFLDDTGLIYVRIDYHGNHYTRLLMDDVFGIDNFRNEVIIKRTEGKSKGEGLSYSTGTESLFVYSKSDNSRIEIPLKPIDSYTNTQEFLKTLKKVKEDLYNQLEPIIDEIFWLDLGDRPGERSTSSNTMIFGKNFKPPKGRHWVLGPKRIEEEVQKKRIRVVCTNCGFKYLEGPISTCKKCNRDQFKVQRFYNEETVTSNWTDIQSYSQSSFLGNRFPTENAEILLKRVIESSTQKGDLVMDFFLGSGTAVATAHKLGRKWIGIEMGEQFENIILPRMKLIVSGNKSGISKEVNWKGGGFFKYFRLEQFENTLQRVKYEKADPFFLYEKDLYSQYVFLKDLKMLEALEIDYENNKVTVDLARLYSSIDIAETLSNLLGKGISKINDNYVVFEDNEKVNIEDIDYKLIKPLVWWGSE
ncbi:MAG: site-specific DNA-methyltransferase [Candidatus Hermodarchaeota archaeon]